MGLVGLLVVSTGVAPVRSRRDGARDAGGIRTAMLAVGIFAAAFDRYDCDDGVGVIDVVNNAPIAHSNAPAIKSVQLETT